MAEIWIAWQSGFSEAGDGVLLRVDAASCWDSEGTDAVLNE